MIYRELGECLWISSLQGNTLRMLGDIARHAETYRILGECLLISSLSGNALRTIVDIARLADRFNMRFQSLISKYVNLVFLCISFPIVSLFKLAIMT